MNKLIGIILGVVCFAIGYLVAINCSPLYDTGYKTAFMDLRNMVLDAHQDKQKVFYTHGLKVTLEPETMVGVAGEWREIK